MLSPPVPSSHSRTRHGICSALSGKISFSFKKKKKEVPSQCTTARHMLLATAGNWWSQFSIAGCQGDQTRHRPIKRKKKQGLTTFSSFGTPRGTQSGGVTASTVYSYVYGAVIPSPKGTKAGVSWRLVETPVKIYFLFMIMDLSRGRHRILGPSPPLPPQKPKIVCMYVFKNM